jgi:hypothetical protein
MSVLIFIEAEKYNVLSEIIFSSKFLITKTILETRKIKQQMINFIDRYER